MANTHELIEAICKTKGSNITKLCGDIGIPRSVFSELKAGRTKQLSSKYLSSIADYLNVTVDYLLGNEEKPTPKEGELDVKEAITRLEAALSADCAMFDGKRLTDEDKLKAYGGIQFLKAQLAARAANEKDKKSR